MVLGGFIIYPGRLCMLNLELGILFYAVAITGFCLGLQDQGWRGSSSASAAP